MLSVCVWGRQVKNKMTLDQFRRNNRGINDGEDLPDAFLTQIYVSIQRNEIKLKTEAASSAVEARPLPRCRTLRVLRPFTNRNLTRHPRRGDSWRRRTDSVDRNTFPPPGTRQQSVRGDVHVQ